MKIQCNACEAAEAKVLCCADNAALCWCCDKKVHAANKLADKHQRVSLVPASSPLCAPKCDICQEASGYFFCLEDRALFCRKCDLAIHTTNPYVSAHRRFLLTGVQVGLEHTEPIEYSTQKQAKYSEEVAVESLRNGSSSLLFSSKSNEAYYGGPIGGNLPDWPLDDFFGFTAYNQNYGSPKADSGKIGSSDGSPPYFPAHEEADLDGCFGQVPDIASPPTASGLHWQSGSRHRDTDRAAFVPDICPSYNFNANQSEPKRRRPY